MTLQRSAAKAICNLAASDKSTYPFLYYKRDFLLFSLIYFKRKIIIDRMKQDITSIDHIKDDLARVYLETVLP